MLEQASNAMSCTAVNIESGLSESRCIFPLYFEYFYGTCCTLHQLAHLYLPLGLVSLAMVGVDIPSHLTVKVRVYWY